VGTAFWDLFFSSFKRFSGWVLSLSGIPPVGFGAGKKVFRPFSLFAMRPAWDKTTPFCGPGKPGGKFDIPPFPVLCRAGNPNHGGNCPSIASPIFFFRKTFSPHLRTGWWRNSAPVPHFVRRYTVWFFFFFFNKPEMPYPVADFSPTFYRSTSSPASPSFFLRFFSGPWPSVLNCPPLAPFSGVAPEKFYSPTVSNRGPKKINVTKRVCREKGNWGGRSARRRRPRCAA